jgi:hypothetical protein
MANTPLNVKVLIGILYQTACRKNRHNSGASQNIPHIAAQSVNCHQAEPK